MSVSSSLSTVFGSPSSLFSPSLLIRPTPSSMYPLPPSLFPFGPSIFSPYGPPPSGSPPPSFSPPPSPLPKANETTYRSIDLSIGILVAILNVIEIVVIARIRRKKTIYERLLLSLSVADLLFGISNAAICAAHLLRTRNNNSDVKDVFSVTYAFFFYFVLTSTLHILIINLDRLWAISWPLHHRMYATLKKLHILIAVVWITTTLLGVLLFVLNRTAVTTSKRVALNYRTNQAIASVLVIADAVYLSLYGLIIYKIKKMRKFPGNGIDKENNSRHLENKLVTVCTIITFVHMILTAPFAIRALSNGGQVEMWFNAALVANSGVNSIVYFFKGKLSAINCFSKPQHSSEGLPHTASSSMPSTPSVDRKSTTGLYLSSVKGGNSMGR